MKNLLSLFDRYKFITVHSNIQSLYNIASKPQRVIVGLMSGTSLDGLDIALCRISGSGLETKCELLHFETVAYSSIFKEKVRTIFSKEFVSLKHVCLLNPWIALQHAQMVKDSLQKWQLTSTDIDLIASHGQSIYHAPKSSHGEAEFGSGTLQIGDGDHLAVATGIITVSDFRQKHIAAGGEGAPLAMYGDYILATHPNENRILLNIGGIANFTYLPANANFSQVISSDTGPGNTIMDAFIRAHFEAMSYDNEGAIAKQGQVNEELLNSLLNHPFFEGTFPKSSGPELFNLAYLQNAQTQSATLLIAPSDIMATLNKFTAITIASAISGTTGFTKNYTLYVSGGGIHNLVLMQYLKQLMPAIEIKSTQVLGIAPDAKEAILFAILANECVAGESLKAEAQPYKMGVSMGKISFPY